MDLNETVQEWLDAGSPIDAQGVPHAVKAHIVRTRAAGIRTLVETGTCHGDMIAELLNDFDRIYSCELQPGFYAAACQRFAGDARVTLALGDSTDMLPIFVGQLDGPAVFFLDAHWSGGDTARGPIDTPIAFELETILASPHRHVVVIDDARLFGVDQDYPPVDWIAQLAALYGYVCELEGDEIILSDPVTEPQWVQSFARLAADFAGGLPERWREHPVISSACEYGALTELVEEAQYLVGRWANFDELIAANPPTAIHHLYHLARWEDATGVRVGDLRSVIEWGGGYGGLARLLAMLNPGIDYTVIDHPVMLRLHAFFCGHGTRVPFTLAPALPDGCDLFVSTWALSESGAAAQDHVAGRDFFGADHLLLAYRETGFEGSAHFADLVEGLPQAPTTMPDSFYVLR